MDTLGKKAGTPVHRMVGHRHLNSLLKKKIQEKATFGLFSDESGVLAYFQASAATVQRFRGISHARLVCFELYLVSTEFRTRMDRYISLLGLVVMLFLAWLMSAHKTKVSWRIVFGGLALQFAFAILVIKTAPGRMFFDSVGKVFNDPNRLC